MSDKNKSPLTANLNSFSHLLGNSGTPASVLTQSSAAFRHEADKTPTRDRLKLIARIVNVDEWAQKGPLSGYVRC